MFSLGLISGFEIPLAANGLAKRAVSGPVVWNYQLTADETLVFGRHSACSGTVVAQKNSRLQLPPEHGSCDGLISNRDIATVVEKRLDLLLNG
jgi:hypothetical protein